MKNRSVRMAIYIAIVIVFIIYRYYTYDNFDPTNGGQVIHVGADINEIKEKLYLNATRNYIIIFTLSVVLIEYIFLKPKRNSLGNRIDKVIRNNEEKN